MAGNLMPSIVRDQLWRRLPIPLRRALALHVGRLMAPRITYNAEPRLPFIVAGLLKQASGLGAAARSCLSALKCAGLPVYGIDLTTALGQTPDAIGFEFTDGTGIRGPSTVLLHINGPLVPLALIRLGRSFLRDKHIVGHWFWELPQLPPDWRPALSLVHKIFVNTTFVADAVRTLSTSTAVHVVPYPITPPTNATRVNGGSAMPFTVLFAFNVLSNFTRKNPCAVITAFRRAFGEDPSARLVIKHANAAHWPQSKALLNAAVGEATNITLIGDTLHQTAMDDLYRQADVVMSLHRAEGLGLVIAEAMLRGIPVVATNWSGNTDFLDAGTGYPIGYDLVPVSDPQGNYSGDGQYWADASIDEAAIALRILRSDARLRGDLALAGAARAAKFFDPHRYAMHMGQLVGLSA